MLSHLVLYAIVVAASSGRRARSGFSAENLAVMRHMAYNATRKSVATKGGMKRRKVSLTWNPEKILATLRAA